MSEPFENTIAAIELVDDGVIFRVAAIRRFRSKVLNHPVDLAPVANEKSNPDWSSNTTLEEGADFYVANRGDNTIVRMRQDGTVVAVRRVELKGGRSLGNGRLNGIAVSPDESTIWVTVIGHPTRRKELRRRRTRAAGVWGIGRREDRETGKVPFLGFCFGSPSREPVRPQWLKVADPFLVLPRKNRRADNGRDRQADSPGRCYLGLEPVG